MENIITLKNICFEYTENSKTIDNLSINIPRGKHTTILGHNGSGKSTITKLLIGLLVPKSGEIIIDGIKLNEENIYEVRSKIGIVFQNPDNQFIGSTVRDDIAFGLENICVDPSQMDEIINKYAKKVSMEDFLDAEPTKLSGGQKQRVAIAGILAMHPEIIILDEATSMLDPKGRKEINELIHELSANHNITIISITHDIEEAVKSDNIILMKSGKTVKEGKPDEVLNDSQLLESLHLEQPFALALTNKLNETGIAVKPTIYQNEAIKELCQLYLKK